MNNKCQIFTPEPYVKKMLDAIDYEGKQIVGKYILENSCGEGNILIEIVKRYIEASINLHHSTEKIKEDLEKYILGFEIDKEVSDSCIKNLNREVSKYGIKGVKWKINNTDYLKYDLEEKMDFIVGNPPYIMYQGLTLEDRMFLKQNFSSCFQGKFDYCYAFIEKSIKELSNNGRMSYIIPNSIFKNVFGKRIRDIMKNTLEKIYDYRESSIFGKDILTSPAIICLNNKRQGNSLRYYDVDNDQVLLIDKMQLIDKWLFSSNVSPYDYKNSKKFGDFYKVSNSVATLLNEVYVIDKRAILNENEYFIEIEGFHIEKGVLRCAASPRNYSLNREEYIIFPYTYKNSKLEKYEEKDFKLNYPGAYEYLLSVSERLEKRKSDKSAKWFEYGRSQALPHLNQEKILVSSVITNEVRVYRLDKNTIPYSGFYIIPLADKNLDVAEEILTSPEFYSYLSIRGINANGKSLRFSVNDILNFPMNELI
ncbi:N-6 DNA methylase [Aneurinibacillus migulanus]|uniref:Eco57I restriction-modification methylase domain-containing protein n=1 Tax=Aneurinibacillus migulanus TaxID=47500 RepID=UPI002E1B3C70|nr:N-6 DNA methylase [Aneurinibacillus migulanus]MED4732430.1 N-6 DNA methylase [Aneurinibacillus migulanus]